MLYVRGEKMSSCLRMNHESDEDVDLEVLRVAALKSRKPRYPRVNHNNLIPIVPVNIETEFVQKRITPTRETNVLDDNNIKDSRTKENEKPSNHSGNILENDPDILSMDDKEEEDSLEKLMDQLEAEISGKAPIPCSKKLTNSKEKNTQNDSDSGDNEAPSQLNSGKDPKAAIEIRGSVSPELKSKQMLRRNSISPKRSHRRRSGSRLRSRSRSFYSGGRSYRRSKSPYWSRSPQKSKSPYRRSRSPYWSFRRTRSKSRSPVRRYRSPGRKRSPFSRFSRSRSRSYGRRRSPWSLSPRRSKSPFYRDGLISPRRRNFDSPGRPRRSYTPKDFSKSPRRRSRSPRRVPRHSPYRRSKSPYRSKSLYKRTPLRRSKSPISRLSKSPDDKVNSSDRSPLGKRHSNSPIRNSMERTSSKPRSPLRRPGRPKSGRSRSKSPVPFRNRSPLKAVEKNKLDEKIDKSRDRDRLGRRHRSLSRENNRAQDRRSYRRGGFFPSRKRNTKSPKQKRSPDKNKIESKPQKEQSPVPSAPLDPVLEARKKKFETLGEVDPTVDKKISLKAIKESTENPEEDEDALTINVENNLWEETEESEDECESRFKSNGAKKNCVTNPRSVLSFRNLGENDTKKKVLNKPLTDENRRDNRSRDSWLGKRNDSERRKRPLSRGRSEDNDCSKSKFKSDKAPDDDGKKSNRKPIVWYSKNERKFRKGSKDNEKSGTRIVISDSNNKSCERIFNESGKGNKNSDLLETDDFDKLISDFERELESDICFSSNELNAVSSQEENQKPRISVKEDLVEPKLSTTESTTKPPRIVRIRDAPSTKNLDAKSVTKATEVKEKIIQIEEKEIHEGPEDYIEDDDFVLEVSATKQKKVKKEEEDKQSDLRAVLSKRRNERLIKVVSLPENMPARLILSAFQGLGHKKLQKADNEEVQDLEFPSVEKNVKTSRVENRRVLLLHRDKNPLKSIKSTVPEAKPDTTIHQRLPWSKDRRKRKLLRQQDPSEEVDQEEEEERFEVEEEKHFPRFRLKRKITISSQYAEISKKGC